MLSTVLEIGSIIALIGGGTYIIFQYAPYIIEFFNHTQNIAIQLSEFIPDWLQPFVMGSMLLSGIGLLVKLL